MFALKAWGRPLHPRHVLQGAGATTPAEAQEYEHMWQVMVRFAEGKTTITGSERAMKKEFRDFQPRWRHR